MLPLELTNSVFKEQTQIIKRKRASRIKVGKIVSVINRPQIKRLKIPLYIQIAQLPLRNEWLVMEVAHHPSLNKEDLVFHPLEVDLPITGVNWVQPWVLKKFSSEVPSELSILNIMEVLLAVKLYLSRLLRTEVLTLTISRILRIRGENHQLETHLKVNLRIKAVNEIKICSHLCKPNNSNRWM